MTKREALFGVSHLAAGIAFGVVGCWMIWPAAPKCLFTMADFDFYAEQNWKCGRQFDECESDKTRAINQSIEALTARDACRLQLQQRKEASR